MEKKTNKLSEEEFRLKRETEKRVEAEEKLKVEQAKADRRQLVITVLLKRLETKAVEISKEEFVAAANTDLIIVPAEDKFTIHIR
ncbi:MAG: hypothetical protein IJ410_03505 [Oscillospiraceae bacterium]|nr:hypothetical protein [Oscillospiraceae bacterium]